MAPLRFFSGLKIQISSLIGPISLGITYYFIKKLEILVIIIYKTKTIVVILSLYNYNLAIYLSTTHQ